MHKIGLFLTSQPSAGGIFQYNLSMLEALSVLPRNRYKPQIFYFDASWEKYIKAYDIESVHLRKSFWDRLLYKIWIEGGLSIHIWRKASVIIHPLTQKIIQFNCDLLIFPSQDHLSYLLPVKSVGTIHDLMHRYEQRFPEVSANGEFERREVQYRNLCRWSYVILVDSQTGKKHVCESYDVKEEKIKILPYTPPKYIYSKVIPPDFDKCFSLPSKYIFYPAQFWQHKNHSNLIRAVNKLKTKLKDIRLVLAGRQKNYYETIVMLVEDLNLKNHVHFLGCVPDEYMPELYRRARAMVMPTFFGPTNIPPLEAFVTGCPAAISNIYGMPEQIGDAALFFDPSSVDEIAQAIDRLWTEDELCVHLASQGKIQLEKSNQGIFNQNFTRILDELT